MALTISQLTHRFSKRLHDDKDLVVAITGDEGSGKSALAIQMGLEVDVNFNLERNILYSPTFEEMKDKILGLPKYSVIVADESIKALYKMFWQNKLQQYTNILFALCRQENKLSLLCIPRFSDLNEFFRQHRVKFWIHIIDDISRSKEIGHAVVFAKGWNPFSLDNWNYKEMQKEIDNYARMKRLKEVEFGINHRNYILSRSRNYVGTLQFGRIPDELFERYMKLKRKFAYESLGEQEDKESKKGREATLTKHNKMLIIYMHEVQQLSYERIAEIMGVSKQTVMKTASKDV